MQNKISQEKDIASIQAKSFFWNACYAGFSAVQSVLILFVGARALELSQCGIITFGFTIGNFIMILGNYGIRNFQVTDVKEEFSFSDYLYCRIITVPAALLLSVVYLVGMLFVGRYSGEKAIVVLEIVALKLVDSFEGVYVGRLQQKGRLDVGSEIASIRIVLSTVLICCVLWFTHIPWISFLAGLMLAVVLDILLLPKSSAYADFSVMRFQLPVIRKLLLLAFPLCVGTALHNYAGNAPKYLVDFFLNDEIQAISGYVMMPMFVITLLNTFIMQPTVKTIGEAWNNGDETTFRKIVLRHILIISVLSLFVLLGGITIGLPVLSWMFRAELGSYRREFTLLIIGGTMYTLSAYLIVLLTTVRKQHVIVIGCMVSLAVYVATGDPVIGKSGFMGACILYIVANLIMLLVFIFGLQGHTSKKVGDKSC